ncbi:MAG TPA: hypothetical protein VEU62_00850, partial [Bryobacterales bacterium]|nr:hypothetical protein [Bryobacterales bacterium]
MARPSRREVLQLVSALGAAGPHWRGVAAAAPGDAVSLRISRYELLPVRVPMAGHLREAWNASWSRQKRDQTHFTPIFVRLHTDAGVSGIGEAKMERAEAEAVLRRMVGRSPWEFLQDDGIQGVLIAVYDLLGKATGLPVARLLAPHPQD